MHSAGPSLILAIIFFAFYQYAKYQSYRDPGSVFFDETRAYQRRYSNIRADEVKDTIIDSYATPNANPSTCAIFTTWKRPIETTLQSALTGLFPQERADIHLAVLFAHADPTTHPSWNIKVDKSLSYEKDSQLAKYEAAADYLHKGIGDYTLALEYCMKKNLTWTAVFEDDVLFADSWYARLKQALVQSHSPELLYLRMFNDERATGWANKGFFANGESYIAAIIDACAVVLLRKKHWTLMVPVLLFIPAAVSLFYASGKASMLPPGPGIRQENFGCCSQALIYPQHQLAPLIDYLRAEGSGQVDVLVNRFGRERGLHRKSVYPMMVQHRGSSSVRGTTAQDAQRVWSMAFEDLDPAQLRRDHSALAGKIWPEILAE